MKPNRSFAFFLLVLLVVPLFSSADDEPTARLPWTMDDSYNGPHRDSYLKLRLQVPNLIRQTMINMSGATGLRFDEGWEVPLTVRFVDGSPPGTENVLAYVQLMSDGRRIFQDLNINLAEYDKENFNFDKVFAHELVHAMMNDAIGGEASAVLPVWFHEGLAVYGADQGEQMVNAYLKSYPERDTEDFVNGLEGPHSALDYAEDYLAIKYMHDRVSVNALHTVIRDLVKRKGDIQAAIQAGCNQSWEEFQAGARKFAIEDMEQRRRGMHEMRSDTTPKPY